MVARRSASSEFLGATATGLIVVAFCLALLWHDPLVAVADRKSTRLNSSHSQISYAVFCLKKKDQLSEAADRPLWHLDAEFRSIQCRRCDARAPAPSQPRQGRTRAQHVRVARPAHPCHLL